MRTGKLPRVDLREWLQQPDLSRAARAGRVRARRARARRGLHHAAGRERRRDRSRLERRVASRPGRDDQPRRLGRVQRHVGRAPQIAGACALIKQAWPRMTPAEAKDILMRTARDVAKGRCARETGHHRAGPGPDLATGHGIGNATKATLLAKASSPAPPGPAALPTVPATAPSSRLGPNGQGMEELVLSLPESEEEEFAGRLCADGARTPYARWGDKYAPAARVTGYDVKEPHEHGLRSRSLRSLPAPGESLFESPRRAAPGTDLVLAGPAGARYPHPLGVAPVGAHHVETAGTPATSLRRGKASDSRISWFPGAQPPAEPNTRTRRPARTAFGRTRIVGPTRKRSRAPRLPPNCCQRTR